VRLVADLPAGSTADCVQEAHLLDAITSALGRPLPASRPRGLAASASSRFCARCAPVSFDTSGFYLDTWERHPLDGTDVARVVSLDRECPLEFNLYIDYNLEHAPGKPYSIVTSPVADDKEIYRERREFASWWMRKKVQMNAPWRRSACISSGGKSGRTWR
jgi:hypothetical protein